MSRTVRRRGEPLVALGGVLASWVAARAAILALPGTPQAPVLPPVLFASAAQQPQAPQGAVTHAGSERRAGFDRIAAPVSRSAGHMAGPVSAVPAAAAPRPLPLQPLAAPPQPATVPPRPPSPSFATISGHQLLYAAAFAQLPLPAGLFGSAAAESSRPAGTAARARWSADGWLLLRPDYRAPGQSNGGLRVGPYPVYGGSQAGAVLRYRLVPTSARQPFAYLRVTSAIAPLREQDLALGLSVRPLARLPLRAAAEVRPTQVSGRTLLRPAAFVVTELAPLALPHGFRAEAYGQAGVVGGAGATAFGDAQLRVDRRLVGIGRAELRGGGGAWGGAQDGAGRVDVGPGITLGVPLGAANARLSADWRFRVAGQAAPASGPAITLSAGF